MKKCTYFALNKNIYDDMHIKVKCHIFIVTRNPQGYEQKLYATFLITYFANHGPATFLQRW